MDEERTITVKGWRGDEVKTLDEYVKIWVQTAQLSKLWIDSKSAETILDIQNQIKALAILNFEYLYKEQNENPT